MTAPNTPPARQPRGQLASEEFSVREVIGGPRGVVESVLPTLLFVVLFVATSDLRIAGGAAVLCVAVFVLVRLVQRQSIASAVGGLVAAVLGAIWAIRSGEGTDFYAPGLMTNAVSLVVVIASMALRFPLVGVFAGAVDPRVAHWRGTPALLVTYMRATALFAGLYTVKLAVQLPMYLAGWVSALGVAKLVMGLPLFALVTYIAWLMHRNAVARILNTPQGDAETP